jgi:hypothetical protein
MDSYLEKSSKLWKFLLIDFSEPKAPITKVEKFIESLKCYGYYFIQLNIIVYTILAFPIFVDETTSKHSLFYSAAIATIEVSVVVRYGVTHWHRLDLLKLMKFFKNNKSPDDIEKYGLEKPLKKIERYTKFIQRFVFYLYALTMTSWFRKALSDHPEDVFTPHFPFDPTRPTIFPFAFLWIFLPQLAAVSALAATESLLCVFIVLTSIEFEIICADIKNLKLVKNEVKSKELKRIVERQIELIEVSAKLERIYSFPFLCNFLLSSLMICLNALQIITLDYMQIHVDLGFTACSLFFIWLQCHFGEMLRNSSEKITNELYACGWEVMSDGKFKKEVLLAMVRSQSPVTFTYMGFADVQMMQFTNVSSLFMIILGRRHHPGLLLAGSDFCLLLLQCLLEPPFKVIERSWEKSMNFLCLAFSEIDVEKNPFLKTLSFLLYRFAISSINLRQNIQ